jgi:hypothetical protein
MKRDGRKAFGVSRIVGQAIFSEAVYSGTSESSSKQQERKCFLLANLADG